MSTTLRRRDDLHVSIRAGREKGVSSFLKKQLLAAHQLLRSSLRDFCVALVDNRTMSRLHLTFLNEPGPTDVLTFPLEFDSRGRATSGEVVICAPYARKTARDAGTVFRNELLLYALHGMLHLSGFDDRNPRQFRRMHRMEDKILGQLGIGPVFDPKGKP